jgi:alkylhydroperoxidase family enzyme
MSDRLGPTVDAVRALVPAVAASQREIEENVLRSGIVDSELKELCFRHLAGEPQRDVNTERERAALDWTDAITQESALADDALWARLHALFSESELVELGCAIGFELGFQHWRRSLGLSARD